MLEALDDMESVINYGRTKRSSAGEKVWVQERATRREIPVGGDVQHVGEHPRDWSPGEGSAPRSLGGGSR